MRKYELTLSPNYVPSWTVVDAVRELFQNAIDQQATIEGNEMFHSYDEGTQVLTIGNKLSVLEAQTLLLGNTTKVNDGKTIGQFGEGYKVATLVLLRLEKEVTFLNYGLREVWKPRFVNSKKYNSQILTFFVDKPALWQNVPDNNLTISIKGITLEEYEQIVESNLHLQTLASVEETPCGRILLDDNQSGKVYVNGLFVCKYEPYIHGYDFKPKYIKLDRDRKLVSDFDLKWMSSKMWAQTCSEKVAELAFKKAPDVAWLQYQLYEVQANTNMYDKAVELFKEEHGEKAVPVTNQDELNRVPKTHKAVIVSEGFQQLIKRSDKFEKPEEVIPTTPLDDLREWFETYCEDLDEVARESFASILKALEEM